jgi:glycosyltransferase involved in cell wall biosynthesis
VRIALFTNEYPPHVYGGAGVHVEYLARELARADGGANRVDVLCFGEQHVSHGNLRVHGISPAVRFPAQDPRHAKLLDALVRNLAMVGAAEAPDIVHCHTWYSHLAGCLARPLNNARLVLTTHSLADGVIAVSRAMKEDVQTLYGVPSERVRVIHNGIDPDEYRPRHAPDVLRRLGVDPDVPIVLFVGRITRQKGILHLVRAIRYMTLGVQVVLCAGAPDTPAIADEMTALVRDAKEQAEAEVVWIPEMLPKEDVIALYSHAAVFVCPSVYEPFGIINLEAMACETPVVASAVGGIPEIVVPGETGLLVYFEAEGPDSPEPRDPDAFARALAAGVNELVSDSERRTAMGKAARERVLAHFSWKHIAEVTLDFYRELLVRSP